MTETERTTGGPLGRIAGKLKEAAGSAVGNDELAREGRLQQAHVDAAEEAVGEAAEARQREAEAALEEERARTQTERERLQAEQAAAQREQAAEADRARTEAAAQTR